jgi:hypothetical protein
MIIIAAWNWPVPRLSNESTHSFAGSRPEERRMARTVNQSPM